MPDATPAAAVGDGAAAGFGAAAGLGVAVEDAADVFAAFDFAESAAAYHVLMPLWPLHAPDFNAAVVKLPSLHTPVEPVGAPAGACAETNWEKPIPRARTAI